MVFVSTRRLATFLSVSAMTDGVFRVSKEVTGNANLGPNQGLLKLRESPVRKRLRVV
jgi:hypothetical protein